MKIGKKDPKKTPVTKGQQPDPKVIEEKALQDLAAQEADKRLAAGNEDDVVVMQAQGDQTSVSIKGAKALQVDKDGRIRTTVRHVPELRAHGFEVVNVTSL